MNRPLRCGFRESVARIRTQQNVNFGVLSAAYFLRATTTSGITAYCLGLLGCRAERMRNRIEETQQGDCEKENPRTCRFSLVMLPTSNENRWVRLMDTPFASVSHRAIGHW